MQRRNFLKGILRAGAGFAILPSAMLYSRKWKFSKNPQGLFIAEFRYATRPMQPTEFIYFYVDMPPMFDERILA